MRQTYHQERGKRCCFAMTLLVQRMINDKEQLLLKIHAFELKHGSYFGTCSSPLSVASIYYYLIPLKLRLPFYGSSGLVGHSHCCAGGPNSAVVAMSRPVTGRSGNVLQRPTFDISDYQALLGGSSGSNVQPKACPTPAPTTRASASAPATNPGLDLTWYHKMHLLFG